MTDGEIVQAFVRYYTEGAETDSWAPLELNELAIHEPETAWRIIRAINREVPRLDEAWAPFLCGVIGCGPLETLIALHQEAMLQVILSEASENAILRKELSTIYENSVSPSARSRINLVLGQS